MTQPSKNGENAVDMLAVARIAQGVDIAGFAGPDAVKLVAPAKVNLFLDIGAKRADGYHEAVSIMHALMLHDVLRMKLAPGRGEGLSVDLSCVAREGLAMLDVPVESNIVAKAVRLLEAARSLGADVAFFLHGGCACFTGVGDAFDHALAPMNGNVVLVKPEGGVSTAAAYRAFDEHPTVISEADREAALEAQRAADVPLRNNLVPVSEHLLPALVDIRLWASERADVQRVLMSGSGSAVFMQCATFADAGRVAAEARMRGWWARATMFGSARAAVVPNR